MASRRSTGTTRSAHGTRCRRETTSDFFNGIAAARFVYASNTAYVSVPFSSSFDTIYLRVINSAQQSVAITYQGISKYYDNRKAAVTIDFDDLTDDFLPDFVQAISLIQQRICASRRQSKPPI